MSDSSKPLIIPFIGNTYIGKTSLVQRMAGEIRNDNEPTIGVQYYQRKVLIDGSKTELLMWDTNGHIMVDLYCRAAACVVIAFDLTNKESFDDIPRWLQEIKEPGYKNVPKLILGNKSDLQDIRTVSQQEIERFIKWEKIPYLDVSAKTGENVEKALVTVIMAATEITEAARISLLSKIVLVGRSLTGKTCLVQSTFQKDKLSTASIYSKARFVKVEGLEVGLEMWDTPGKWKDRSAITNCYRDARGIIIVFDLTDLSSFDDAKVWLDQIKNHVQDKRCCKMILGNKSDLQRKRVISGQKIQEFIGKERIPYFEVSSKTGKNVEEAFVDIARRIEQVYGPFKIVFVGSGSTGKTCLINTLEDSIYKSGNRKIKLVSIDKDRFKFQLVDAVGQDGQNGYKGVKESDYDYENAHGVVIMFDLTGKNSFDDVKGWLESIENKNKGRLCKIILGNKSDLRESRVINRQEIRDLIKEVKISYFEISAQTGENVEEAFFYLAKNIKRTFIGDINYENKNYIISEGESQQQNNSDISDCNLF